MAVNGVQTFISLTDGFSKNFILFEKRIHHALMPIKKMEKSLDRLNRVSRFDLFKKGFSDFRKNSKDFILSVRNIGQSFGYVKTAVVKVADALNTVSLRGDDIAKTSRRLGLSVESLQKFRHAADLAGVPVDSMQESMRKMAVCAFRASQGVEKESKAFKALKISVKNADGSMKDNEQLILEMADRFANAGYSATEKLYIANEVFGKSGSKMIELLNQGSDALHGQFEEMVKLGLMTEEEAKASEQYNDALAKMRRAIDGIQTALAADLLGPMTEAVEYLTNFLIENKDVFKKSLEPFVKSIPVMIEHITAALPGVLEAFVKFADWFDWFVDHLGIKFPAIAIVVANVIAPFTLALAGLGKMLFVVGRAVAAVLARFISFGKSVNQVSVATEKTAQKTSFLRSALGKINGVGKSSIGIFRRLTSTLQKTGSGFSRMGKAANVAGANVSKTGNTAAAVSTKMVGALAAAYAVGDAFERMTDKENERYKNMSGFDKFLRVSLDVVEDVPIFGSFVKGIENLSVDKIDFGESEGLTSSLTDEDFELMDLVKSENKKAVQGGGRIDVNFNNFPKEHAKIKKTGFDDPTKYGFSMSPAF